LVLFLICFVVAIIYNIRFFIFIYFEHHLVLLWVQQYEWLFMCHVFFFIIVNHALPLFYGVDVEVCIIVLFCMAQIFHGACVRVVATMNKILIL
jgi:hypothetical protein